METIVDDSSVKITSFARFRQNTSSEIKNSQPSEFFDERHQNMLQRQKLYLRSKATTENTIELSQSVYDEKLYFCKIAQTTLTCCVVTLACLVATAPVISTN